MHQTADAGRDRATAVTIGRRRSPLVCGEGLLGSPGRRTGSSGRQAGSVGLDGRSVRPDDAPARSSLGLVSRDKRPLCGGWCVVSRMLARDSEDAVTLGEYVMPPLRVFAPNVGM